MSNIPNFQTTTINGQTYLLIPQGNDVLLSNLAQINPYTYSQVGNNKSVIPYSFGTQPFTVSSSTVSNVLTAQIPFSVSLQEVDISVLTGSPISFWIDFAGIFSIGSATNLSYCFNTLVFDFKIQQPILPAGGMLRIWASSTGTSTCQIAIVSYQVI